MKTKPRKNDRPMREAAIGLVDALSDRDIDLLIDILYPRPKPMLRVLDGGK